MDSRWASLCGELSEGSLCPGFSSAYRRYAAEQTSATSSLTIDDAWSGEGLGFMSGVSAQWLLLAMASGRALFLDFRRSKFASVLHDFRGIDGVDWAARPPGTHSRGAETRIRISCEGICPHAQQKMARLLRDRQGARHLRLVGNQLKASLPQLWARLNRAREGEASHRPRRELSSLTADEASSERCLSCAMFALLQPRSWDTPPWRTLTASLAHPLAPSSAALQHRLSPRPQWWLCLKIRTGYAEDRQCDPSPHGMADSPASVDASYLRLPNCGEDAYQRSGVLKRKLRWRRATRSPHQAPDIAVEPRHLNITDALGCVHSAVAAARERGDSSAVTSTGSQPSTPIRALLITDAPGLQRHLLHRAAAMDIGPPGLLVATPGIGIDPTSEVRQQNRSIDNLRKVVMDFRLQGSCLCSLVLLPSAFYEAASIRTRHGAFEFPGPRPISCEALSKSCPWQGLWGD